MPGFVPFAGRNAIAEMSVGIQFQLPFDLGGKDFSPVKADFADDFPKFESLQSFVFAVGPQSFPFPPQPSSGGFVLTRSKNDGTPARVLRVQQNLISIHFMEYSSWAEVKPIAIATISKTVPHLAGTDTNLVTSIVMRYVDRFTYDGEPTAARANAIFDPNTAYVASQIFKSDHRWHCNSGWFEPLIDTLVELNVLNIASSLIESSTAIIIDHSSIFGLPLPGSPYATLRQGAPNCPPLEAILDSQHTSNRKLLRNLLNTETLAAIGLRG